MSQTSENISSGIPSGVKALARRKNQADCQASLSGSLTFSCHVPVMNGGASLSCRVFKDHFNIAISIFGGVHEIKELIICMCARDAFHAGGPHWRNAQGGASPSRRGKREEREPKGRGQVPFLEIRRSTQAKDGRVFEDGLERQ